MARVKTYISTNFLNSFLTIFLPFFMIISLVYLVKIAGLTAKIQLTFLELLKLYAYSVPDIIFYTLPLSFIASLTNILIKLSQENELIALYALGLNAKKLLRKLLLLAILFSLLLGAISFLAMPLSKQLYKSFKKEKQSEAKLNIVAGELGQKFGEYYIYVKDKKKDTYQDMVIYNRSNQQSEQFFAAKTGKLNHKNSTTSLQLNDGYGYTYEKNKLQEANYKVLKVYDNQQNRQYHFEDVITHWSKAQTDLKMMRRALFFIFVSFIPLLALYLVASFAMINPRYQHNHTFLIISSTAIGLYVVASILEKWGTPLTLAIALISTMLLGLWLFQKRVLKYF